MVDVGLAGNDGVVNQFFAHHFAQKFVVGQIFGEMVVIGEVFFVAHAVHEDDFFKLFVNVRVARYAQKRCQTGAGGEQVQVFAAFVEVAGNQGAGGLFADEDVVADFQMLQAAGERAVLHFDAEKFQMFFPVRAGDAVCTHQGFTVHHQADHDELAVFKAQAFVAGAGE